VLQGLKGQKISEQAHGIIKQVINLEKHFLTYEEYLKKLGRNLGTTVNMYNSAYKEFGKIDKDFLKITGESMETEPMILESPSVEKEETLL
jgi:DNA recombination protein RmuC